MLQTKSNTFFLYSRASNSEVNGSVLAKFRNEPRHEKTCLMPYANNKGADQPAHPRLCFPCLDSTIPILAKSKVSRR